MFEISTGVATYYFNVEFFYDHRDLSLCFSDGMKQKHPEEILLALGLKMFGDVYSHTRGSYRGVFSMVGSYSFEELCVMSGLTPRLQETKRNLVRWIYSTIPPLKNNYIAYYEMGLLFNTHVSLELNIGETLRDTYLVARKGK